jgi:hypothetical protein
MRQGVVGIALLVVVSLNTAGQSQPPSDGVRFEVASVKPSQDLRAATWDVTPGRFTALTRLLEYVTFAYDTEAALVSGPSGPAPWSL